MNQINYKGWTQNGAKMGPKWTKNGAQIDKKMLEISFWTHKKNASQKLRKNKKHSRLQFHSCIFPYACCVGLVDYKARWRGSPVGKWIYIYI